MVELASKLNTNGTFDQKGFDSNSSVINDQLEAAQLVTNTRANQVGTPVAKLLPNHVESFTLSPDTLLPVVNTVGTNEIVGDAVGMSPSGKHLWPCS